MERRPTLAVSGASFDQSDIPNYWSRKEFRPRRSSRRRQGAEAAERDRPSRLDLYAGKMSAMRCLEAERSGKHRHTIKQLYADLLAPGYAGSDNPVAAAARERRSVRQGERPIGGGENDDSASASLRQRQQTSTESARNLTANRVARLRHLRLLGAASRANVGILGTTRKRLFLLKLLNLTWEDKPTAAGIQMSNSLPSPHDPPQSGSLPGKAGSRSQRTSTVGRPFRKRHRVGGVWS